MSGRLMDVMGPSGAGKDTLLAYARQHLAGHGTFFAHRYITRPAAAGGENHVALTDEEFTLRSDAGLFALEWSSHRLRYGIGIEIDTWLAHAQCVVINGSRGHLGSALQRYPALRPILIEAAPEVLAMRLAARGRETAGEVLARLARQPDFDVPAQTGLVRIDNSGLLADAGAALIRALRGDAQSNGPHDGRGDDSGHDRD
jgi:ribose 1,5-bisphosphokinase